MDIQNRMVFAVELEFTSSSPLSRAPRFYPGEALDPCFLSYCFPRAYARLPEESVTDKPRWLRPMPFEAAKPYPTHKPLDAVRKAK